LDLAQHLALSFCEECLTELAAGPVVCVMAVSIFRCHEGTLLPFR
jgi:hypothetical protein